MGKRGTKPKPAAFKVLHGNPGKRGIPPEPSVYGALVAPEWMEGDALDKWNQLAPELQRSMGAALLDSDSLAAYCYAWATFVRLRDAEDTVMSDKGAVYQNPEVGIRNKSLEQMRKFGAVLGLSPSDRVGLKPMADDQNAMDKAYFA
jgi:P27 family predicted phage terminase small subunit